MTTHNVIIPKDESKINLFYGKLNKENRKEKIE